MSGADEPIVSLADALANPQCSCLKPATFSWGPWFACPDCLWAILPTPSGVAQQATVVVLPVLEVVA